MTTKQDNRPIPSGKQRVTLAASSIVALAGVGGIIVFGYSTLSLMAIIGGIAIGTASYIYHHITSGAYLPAERQDHNLRKKLYSLKFKLDGQFDQIIDQVIDQVYEQGWIVFTIGSHTRW